MAGISREQAIEMIKRQLGGTHDSKQQFKRVRGAEQPPWHFGRCELADLLSEIYGVQTKPGDLT